MEKDELGLFLGKPESDRSPDSLDPPVMITTLPESLIRILVRKIPTVTGSLLAPCRAQHLFLQGGDPLALFGFNQGLAFVGTTLCTDAVREHRFVALRHSVVLGRRT